jgi:phage recombination protein Bet
MTQPSTALMEIDQRELDVFEAHFRPKDCTDVEWTIFVETCRTYRLSPMRKQMYLVGRWDNTQRRIVYTPQISIGGLRLLALRTHEFEGTTEPEWGDEEGNWYKLWPKGKGKHPYAARIGVYRRNFRAPVWGVAYFHELAQKKKDGNLTKFWDDMGIHMILKDALADALRGAFEEECGGIYLHEEMNQADADSQVVRIIPAVDISDENTNEALRETTKNKATTQQNGNGHTNGNEQSANLQQLVNRAKNRAKTLGLTSTIEEWLCLVQEATGEEGLRDVDINAARIAKINGHLARIEKERVAVAQQ